MCVHEVTRQPYFSVGRLRSVVLVADGIGMMVYLF